MWGRVGKSRVWGGDSFHFQPVAQELPAAKSIIPGTLGMGRAWSSSSSPREVCCGYFSPNLVSHQHCWEEHLGVWGWAGKGRECIPTHSRIWGCCGSHRTGLELWLLGLGGGFSLRLLEVHLFSQIYHLLLLSPMQVTWLWHKVVPRRIFANFSNPR